MNVGIELMKVSQNDETPKVLQDDDELFTPTPKSEIYSIAMIMWKISF
ncbi:6449_t:CDS:2, partial [Rhizophagus irregularis]